MASLIAEREQLEMLADAARAHGLQSESDNEAGDLFDILQSCWNVMSPAQREHVFTEHNHLIEEWRTE
jgi:hypothetical protein